MRKVARSPVTYVLLAVVVGLLLFSVLRSGPSRTPISLGTYEHDLAVRGTVVTATIHDGSRTITGTLRDGTSYVVQYPDKLIQTLHAELRASGAAFNVEHSKSSPWVPLLEYYLPVAAIIVVFLLAVNSMQGGGSRVMQFAKARAKTLSKDQPKVTFADVAGADEAVAELQEIKEFLEAPARFQALGAKIPKGVLLFGPPGTGKTLLARAVAGEAGAPFFSISGSDFVEMFVGVGASRVRDLFNQAKANAPAIVFMDEIDAVGRRRGAGVGGGHDEREQTLNQLLVEMDGFDVRSGVILIAATNRPDILDPALLRPGRFDRQIVVDRPDLAGRRKILAVHAQGKPLANTVDLDVLARRTPGFTGADLANLLNEAAILTARRNLRQIGIRECEEAIDRVLAGPERKTLVMSDHDKLVTAYHEAGHAIVGHVLAHADKIHKVSIVARSRSLGLTFTLPEDRYNHSRSQLRDSMAMALGGRTAEELVFSEPTTGAENDIQKVTGTARAMVTEYGMSDTLGPQQFGQRGGEVFLGRDMAHQPDYSEEVAAAIDREVRALVDEAHDRARAVLVHHRHVLDAMARRLVEKETLDTLELEEILGPLGTWPAGTPVAAAGGGDVPGSIPVADAAAEAPSAPQPAGAPAGAEAPAVPPPGRRRRPGVPGQPAGVSPRARRQVVRGATAGEGPAAEEPAKRPAGNAVEPSAGGLSRRGPEAASGEAGAAGLAREHRGAPAPESPDDPAGTRRARPRPTTSEP